MHRASDTWTVARQVAFYPAEDGKGKWHAAWLVSNTAVCGKPVVLDVSDNVIHSVQGEQSNRIHPFACKRCVRLTTPEGVTAEGVRR